MTYLGSLLCLMVSYFACSYSSCLSLHSFPTDFISILKPILLSILFTYSYLFLIILISPTDTNTARQSTAMPQHKPVTSLQLLTLRTVAHALRKLCCNRSVTMKRFEPVIEYVQMLLPPQIQAAVCHNLLQESSKVSIIVKRLIRGMWARNAPLDLLSNEREGGVCGGV